MLLKIKTDVYIPYELIKKLEFTPNGIKIIYRDGTDDFYILADYERTILQGRLDNA